MNCSDFHTFLHGYLDGELDLVRQVEIEEHLRSCSACSRIHEAQQALRSALQTDELYFRAPAHLERKVKAAARQLEREASAPRPRMPVWIGAVVAAAAALALAVFVLPIRSRASQTERIAQDVVSAHVRSLMPGHLTDVPSSDHHTVKPWFAGRLAFSPPVADLSGDGYTLVGGRLDYAGGREVAALVYRRGEHVINLFVWPSSTKSGFEEAADVRQGYNLLSWTSSRNDFCAISDLNAAELRQFARFLRERSP